MGKEEREKCTLVCLIIGPGQIFENICLVSYLNLVLFLLLYYQAINYYQNLNLFLDSTKALFIRCISILLVSVSRISI